ncbi:MAG: hypothetical protein J6V36_01655 [Clostridia bacterium]|nr:hypothetical protein [Clostridia bacterium]
MKILAENEKNSESEEIFEKKFLQKEKINQKETNKCFLKLKGSFEKKNCKNKEVVEDFENMSDIQLIKTVLSYMCSKNEYTKAAQELKDVVDVSHMMNIDSLCLAFGSYSQKSASFLKVIKKLFSIQKQKKKSSKTLALEENLEILFKKRLENELTESICVAFLNKEGKAVFAKKYASNNRESIDLEAWDVVKYAIKLDVSNIAVAHNHPSGSLTCSSRDYNIIKSLCLLLKSYKIKLVCHYVVSPKGLTKTDSEVFRAFYE